jgi:hypothetical protein
MLVAVLSLVQVGASSSFDIRQLLFSELLPLPAGGDRGEFIELFNPTVTVFDTTGYQVCDFQESTCTELAGSLQPASYFALCADVSQYVGCNIGTKIAMGDFVEGETKGLKLINGDGVTVDAVVFENPPIGSAYTRGVSASLFSFEWNTNPTPDGTGFLGPISPGAESNAPIVPPTPVPIRIPTTVPTAPSASPIKSTPSPLVVTPTVAPVPTTTLPTDLCATAFCHPRASCKFVNNAAKCTCNVGFEGDGQFVCNDVDGEVFLMPFVKLLHRLLLYH